MIRARIYYPWISIVCALVIVAWQFILSNMELIDPHRLPELLTRQSSIIAAAAILILLILFDITHFVKALAGYKTQLKQYQGQISELFDSKRELGTLARTNSDHAEKLKLFISDRLLEYMEYDEKFLHFKNIASEVRHNGVISYDKVQSALQRARNQGEDEADQDYQEAADSLLYLWDLLDLSTTDNIALHVANQVYDSEEYYFQSLLNQADVESSPYTPTFTMSRALLRALQPIADNPEELRTWDMSECPETYIDSKFNIRLHADSELLGNENHMVLLIENLLNNALFYAQQKTYKNRYSRVTILLSQLEDRVELRVYNRGPRIKEEDKERIYQLGYSSRRIRDHHGKGLGLYFVNEITRGFEGTIKFKNVENSTDNLSLRVELIDGEVHTHMVSIVEINGKPLCKQGQADDPVTRKLEWTFSSPVASVEVSSQFTREPQIKADLQDQETLSQVDAIDPLSPRWVLEISNKKRSSKLVFLPIDARGVQFIASFPTAISRVDNPETDIVT